MTTDLPAVFVDADACPVKEEAMRVAGRHGLMLHMVSNQWMRLPESPLIKRVVVSDGFDAADDWIAENIREGDIAVTSDIPLAARCLEKGARVLKPNGESFTKDGIGMALAMRDLMAHLRDTGEISGGGPAFGKQDRSRFLNAMETQVQAAKRRQ
ncbi:YaiI/YqxD family protein [Aestuariispira ectoiniformans]|uniref:YaiI/YqxD family protein n=1 Tax=Aestuariispira ectoiniformans TaxID=2775080 RepID=UPI00223BA8DD|nr:YaiI/YqxD family protein [Aestuariispira ectoiniformans]